jgi:cell fate regulator YaaT (PSP1 superfamily)
MSEYREDASMQGDEELGGLEDSRDREPERPRGRATDPRELPRPLYRIKATHSNETFYAYFPESKAAPAVPAEPAATAAAAEAPDPEAVAEEAGIEGRDGEQAEAEGTAAAGETDESPARSEARDETRSETRAEPPSTGARPKRTLVVVPTRYGRDVCELQGVVNEPGQVGKDEIVPIERVATEEDLRKVEANREREEKAFETCRQKIAARNLPMKLVSAHYLLEEPKVLFYFSAESRVDFRELVKDLVAVFKIRIELRQIGVRDEARVTGGCGVCGRVLCCHGVTDKLVPVSIKMAKDQNLSLNSMKISGPCGRLLCCLAYEYGLYRDARRELPGEGARFQYDGVQFRVIEVNALSESVKMAGEDGRILDMPSTRFYHAEGRWHVKEATKTEAEAEKADKAEG